MIFNKFIPALFCSLLALGSAAAETKPGPLSHLPVVDLRNMTSVQQILAELDPYRVVFVGETHTRYDHHLVQLEVLRQMYARTPGMALGVEWFQAPFQPVLDDYLAGRIDEQQLLHASEYFTRWRFDYRLYRPIIQFAKEQGIPIVALNASKELTSAIRKDGLDDLPAELRRQLPDDYDWSNKVYEKELRGYFDKHPGFPGKFEDFLRVQLTWDEGMATQAARYLRGHPQRRMLILAGNGHVSHGHGIPQRLKRRLPEEDMAILLPTDGQEMSPGMADFLVLSPEQTLPPIGLMGAFLEDSKQGVKITGVSDEGAAKEAGLREGDLIGSIDSQPVQHFAHLKLIMLPKRQGDKIDLVYQRPRKDGTLETHELRLTLR